MTVAAWIVAGWISSLVSLVSLISASLVPLVPLVPLEVYPSRGNGFAASIVGALVALGVLIVVMKFVSSKPRNRRRRGL
jgi:VIT1/CCC1 family predicted Fe2+/Mn2+ transporter